MSHALAMRRTLQQDAIADAALEPGVTDVATALDIYFVLASGFLVFFMQCGFCMVSQNTEPQKRTTKATAPWPRSTGTILNSVSCAVVGRLCSWEKRQEHHLEESPGCLLRFSGLVPLWIRIRVWRLERQCSRYRRVCLGRNFQP